MGKVRIVTCRLPFTIDTSSPERRRKNMTVIFYIPECPSVESSKCCLLALEALGNAGWNWKQFLPYLMKVRWRPVHDLLLI